MILKFSVKPRIAEKTDFDFGNIDSSYGHNSLYFTRDSKPYYPISGEFHFSRYDRRHWRREVQKMKANGITTVASYIFWIHHEKEEGVFDFSGNNDIRAFIGICKDEGMNFILRVGPWAHGECKYGGFPEFVQKAPGKRSDNAVYLARVKRFFEHLYEEVKEYLDGEVILGIQVENEYTGDKQHVLTLRDMLVEIGYKTPFFTMTGWPRYLAYKNMLPTFGLYPSAPWMQYATPLPQTRRFDIQEIYGQEGIGEDLVKKKFEHSSFEGYPYAGCEVGTGNQVTAHRRPLIREKDGYSPGFCCFASGMNWMGYYMYHGGRNPRGDLLQESRNSGYPNNYTIIDYDFQAALSKDGMIRPQAHRLRLMHTFISNYDPDIPTLAPSFVERDEYSLYDVYGSVRCDENLHGYIFISNYERQREAKSYPNTEIVLEGKNLRMSIPSINIAPDAMFFFPINFEIDGVKIDYLLAQPIAREDNTLYFTECEGIVPQISIKGERRECANDFLVGNTRIIILSKEEADRFYLVDGKVYFSDHPVFCDNQTVYSEKLTETDAHGISLEQISPAELPYDEYLYSEGPRSYYKLGYGKIDSDCEDLLLRFSFDGNSLQIFADGELTDDYFNTDGYFEFRLSSILHGKNENEEVIIKCAAAEKNYEDNIYTEIKFSTEKPKIELVSVKKITTEKL